jgi:hypothetical protein
MSSRSKSSKLSFERQYISRISENNILQAVEHPTSLSIFLNDNTNRAHDVTPTDTDYLTITPTSPHNLSIKSSSYSNHSSLVSTPLIGRRFKGFSQNKHMKYDNEESISTTYFSTSDVVSFTDPDSYYMSSNDSINQRMKRLGIEEMSLNSFNQLLNSSYIQINDDCNDNDLDLLLIQIQRPQVLIIITLLFHQYEILISNLN